MQKISPSISEIESEICEDNEQMGQEEQKPVMNGTISSSMGVEHNLEIMSH